LFRVRFNRLVFSSPSHPVERARADSQRFDGNLAH
jgi:hypothetical protein